MSRVKACIAILLSVSLLALTACGAKTSAAEQEENIVVVDFGNLNYSADDFSEVTYSSSQTAESSQSENEIKDDEISQTESVVESEAESESETESETESKNETPASTKPVKKATGIPADPSWFDDCVFMGDSLTVGLSYYNDLTGDLGNADFICSAGLGWHNSQWSLYDENEVHPMYNGEKVLLEDAVALTGANKAIIGLGMNDIGIYGIEDTLDSADEFISKVRANSPGVQIYLQTISPMIAQAEYDALNNPLIKEYDERLEQFASEHNCRFINSWEVLADENGQLPFDLCQDPDALGLHLTNEGCEIWADCILRSVY